MADTTQASQPAKVQYQPPRRSFAGPLILILIGVLLLLATMHALDWRNLLHYYARYWPLLIIFWGLIKLLEYAQDHSAGRPTRGVGGGGVVLLIFLIIIGLTATGLDRVPWDRIRGEMDVNDDFIGLFGNTYDYEQQLQQDFPANDSLRVTVDRGDVTVTTWDQPQIKVVVHKKVVADNEDAAKRVDESTRPVITTAGTMVTLEANPSTGRPVREDLEIFVPKKAALDITTRRGDVTARNRQGDVTVTTARGDVTIEDVTGNTTLNVGRGVSIGRGQVQVSKISGDVAVHGYMNDIKVSDVAGAARLDGEFFGPVELSRITKNVSFKSSRTEMDFAKLDGDLTLDSGDLRGRSLTGPVRLVTHASKDIHLEDVTGPVTVENRSGLVELHAAKLPLGTIDVSTRNGDIQLVLPAKAAFEVEASAVRGDITSDYPGLKIDSSGTRETRAAGSIGNGGPRIVINNEHGNIEIRKAG